MQKLNLYSVTLDNRIEVFAIALTYDNAQQNAVYQYNQAGKDKSNFQPVTKATAIKLLGSELFDKANVFNP